MGSQWVHRTAWIHTLGVQRRPLRRARGIWRRKLAQLTHTYMTLPSHFGPSSFGKGTPHLRSLVIPRLCNPPRSHPSVNAFPFEDHVPPLLARWTNSSICGCSSASLMCRWAVRRAAGVDPHAEHLGLTSSRGDSYVTEQCSHWSPRAPCTAPVRQRTLSWERNEIVMTRTS